MRPHTMSLRLQRREELTHVVGARRAHGNAVQASAGTGAPCSWVLCQLDLHVDRPSRCLRLLGLHLESECLRQLGDQPWFRKQNGVSRLRPALGQSSIVTTSSRRRAWRRAPTEYVRAQDRALPIAGLGGGVPVVREQGADRNLVVALMLRATRRPVSKAVRRSSSGGVEAGVTVAEVSSSGTRS